MHPQIKAQRALSALSICFLGLGVAFWFDLWGHPPALPAIPLVDTNFISTATSRLSAADLVRSGADTSGFECYICHDKKVQLKLKLDAAGDIILPQEHSDIAIHHGRHKRNNNCFNCHDESNLEVLQTRDGRQLKLVESPALCGSCHGPTYRDWEAGVHGRTSGYWKRELGPIDRKACTSCHNPHCPPFPTRPPAPGPHLLHPVVQPLGERTL